MPQTRTLLADQSATADITAPSGKCVGVVECPYCDGENRISSRGRKRLAEKEIACRHCKCLFLVSESEREIRFLPVLRSDAA
jgi:hypothetical protein